MLMEAKKSSLLIVDVQEKLLPAMADPSSVVVNTSKLIRAARILGVPISVSEQYPKGLGHTVDALLLELANVPIFEKLDFSCGQDHDLRKHFQQNEDRKKIIIAGMEAHVCVLQTAIDFVGLGFDVFVVKDACSSRKHESAIVAFERLQKAGVQIVTMEMVLFEWMGKAGTDTFREISSMIK